MFYLLQFSYKFIMLQNKICRNSKKRKTRRKRRRKRTRKRRRRRAFPCFSIFSSFYFIISHYVRLKFFIALHFSKLFLLSISIVRYLFCIIIWWTQHIASVSVCRVILNEYHNQSRLLVSDSITQHPHHTSTPTVTQLQCTVLTKNVK